MSKQLRILIIEDDFWLAEQFERILAVHHYQVQHVPHALAAIDVIDEFKPDAIVLDVLLTGTTAFTLLHELQSYNDTAAIPVVLCTNMAADLDSDQLAPYGVQRILDKSVMQPDDIVTALRSVTL